MRHAETEEETGSPPAGAGPGGGRGTALFLVACLLHGLAYLALLPPWMGEDEPWHFEFVRHVAAGHRPQPLQGVPITQADFDRHPFSQLQVQRRFPDLSVAEIADLQRAILRAMTRAHFWRRVDWTDPLADAASFDEVHEGFTATNQPVGYYLVAGAWLALGRAAGLDGLEAELVWVRALSLAAYVATCAAALAAARLAFADGRVALLAALVVAWLPLNARQAAIVSNDPLARLVASLAFLLALRALRGRGGGSARDAEPSDRHAALRAVPWAAPLGAVALLGTAFLVKTTAVPIAGLSLVVVLGARLRGLAARRALPWVALAGAVGVGGVLYWYHQHNPAMPRSLEALALRVERGSTADAWRNLWLTSIGRFNWESRYLPGRWYWWIFQVLRLLLVLAAVGAVRLRGSRAALAVAAAAFGLQLLAIVARGVTVGRYLVPAALPLGLLLAAGAVALVPRRARGVVLALGAGALVAWDAAFLWAGLALNQYVVWRG